MRVYEASIEEGETGGWDTTCFLQKRGKREKNQKSVYETNPAEKLCCRQGTKTHILQIQTHDINDSKASG